MSHFLTLIVQTYNKHTHTHTQNRKYATQTFFLNTTFENILLNPKYTINILFLQLRNWTRPPRNWKYTTKKFEIYYQERGNIISKLDNSTIVGFEPCTPHRRRYEPLTLFKLCERRSGARRRSHLKSQMLSSSLGLNLYDLEAHI